MKKNRSFLIAAIFFPMMLISSNSVFAEWYLDNIKLNELKSEFDEVRSSHNTTLNTNNVIVAVIDNGINCNDANLAGKCITSTADLSLNFINGNCVEYFNRGNTADTISAHGTKVAGLIVSVAPNVKILPLSYRAIRGSRLRLNLAGAIECAALSDAKIVNISIEANHHDTIKTATCKVICSNKLIVASAGNGACVINASRFPASYNDDEDNSCSCPSSSEIKMADGILKVGGSNSDNTLGEACSNDNALTNPYVGTQYYKSQPAEVYAPGWGVPNDDRDSFNYGTSWSTALVSGCAALRVAFDSMKSDFIWNSDAIVELEHIMISTATKNDHDEDDNESLKMLNCSKVMEDSLPDDEDDDDDKDDKDKDD